MPKITLANIDQEYEKNAGNLRREDVQALQEWLRKQPHLPQITELEVILFLYSCYYRIEAAKATIDAYYTLRTHCSDLFTNRDPREKTLRQALNTMGFAILPGLTPEGYKVSILKLRTLDPSQYVFSDIIKISFMLVDLRVHEIGTMQGEILMLDMDGFQFGHLTKTNIISMKQFIYFLQEAVPFRLKGLYFINTVSFIDKLLAIMKPFIKPELMKMLQLYQKVDDNFLKIVPKQFLPTELGGNAGSYKELQDQTIKRVLDNYEWFIDDEKNARVDESLRPGKAINVDHLFGVHGSFKKLDID